MQNDAPESSQFEMGRGPASPRADMRVEGARRPRGAGGGGIPEDINPGSAETRLAPAALQQGEGPPKTPSPRYNNTYLRNQPAHVLVVDLLEHLAAI